MRLKLFPMFFLALSSCVGSGLHVTNCDSVPPENGFDCTNWKGKASKLPYAKSDGMHAYSSDSFQKLINYCNLRHVAGTPAPEFDECVSSFVDGGFSCDTMTCTLNSQENGISCTKDKHYFVTFGRILQYP